MGVLDALQTAILGLVGAVVLAQFIDSVWSDFSILDNTTVFPMGSVTKFILGLLVLFFLIALVKKMFKETEEEREQIGGLIGQ